MRRSDVENSGVNKITELVNKSDFYSSWIKVQDKEPVWDGFIYAYKDKTDKKEAFQARIPVQVKTLTMRKLDRKRVKYSVEVDDLNAFLNDGGVFYFLVYLSPDREKYAIYYDDLLPVKIKSLLKKVKNKSLSHEFKLLDVKRMDTIFNNFIRDRKLQFGLQEREMLSIQDLQEINNLSITSTISIPSLDVHEIYDFINDNGIYFYANMGDSVHKNLVPIDETNYTITMINTVTTEIRIGEVVYYNEYKIEKFGDSLKAYFGESISIKLNRESLEAEISINRGKRLDDFLTGCKFFRDSLIEGGFNIGNNFFSIPTQKKDHRQKIIDKQNKSLETYTKLQKLFEIFNFSTDKLVINSFTNEEEMNLRYMIQYIVDGDYSSIDLNLKYRYRIKIQDYIFHYKACKEEATGEYILKSFFCPENELPILNEDDKICGYCNYCLLKKDDFIYTSNFNCSDILGSLENSYKRKKSTLIPAEGLFFTLLHAYDESHKPELLKTAFEINEWILNKIPESEIDEINILNRLQIVKRERNFNETEIDLLVQIIESNDCKEDIKFAAHLLMGNDDMAL